MIHANAHRFGALVLVGMLTIGLVASTVGPAVSQTSDAWTPPVVFSTGGQGSEAAAAMDGNGNSVALWGELTSKYLIWSRSKLSAELYTP